MFPYLQHLKTCYEEQNCKQSPEIILETAVKCEKRRKGFAFVSPSTEPMKSPWERVQTEQGCGFGCQGQAVCPGGLAGAKALAGLRQVDEIFVRPRLGSSAVPHVPFLPICPRIR